MNHLSRALLAGCLSLSTPLLSLHAQNPITDDPFVKNTGSTTPAAGKKNAEPWRNCLFVLEIYALDKNDAFAVLDAELGSAARYRRVLDLSKAGKARLDTLTALATKSGQRAVSEAVDEVPYSTEFTTPAAKGQAPKPTAWETRNVGDIFDFEPVMSPDGRTCDINMVPQRTSLAGFRDYGEPAVEASVSKPVFVAQRLTTSTMIAPGEPHYVGTLSPPTATGIANGTAASEVWLAFITLHLQGPTAEELKPPAKAAPWTAIQLEYTCYSLERAQAREVLQATASLAAPWEKLQALVTEKKARLEHVSSIQTKSGQRALAEEVEEVPKVDQVEGGAKPGNAAPASGAPTRFSFHQTGVTVEVEPVVLPDASTVDLNHVVRSGTLLASLKVAGVTKAYLSQPVFETRKVTTSQSVLAGRYQLIGTLNPPGANGVNDRTDSGRTWLLFVRAMPNDP